MSRQYVIVEAEEGSDSWLEERDLVKMLADKLGISERQIIVVYGARLCTIEIKDPARQ